MPHFECGAFNHSATSPLKRSTALKASRWSAARLACAPGSTSAAGDGRVSDQGMARRPVLDRSAMTDPFAFALAVLALLGTPGPTNTLLATAGAAAGWRRSLRLLGRRARRLPRRRPGAAPRPRRCRAGLCRPAARPALGRRGLSGVHGGQALAAAGAGRRARAGRLRAGFRHDAAQPEGHGFRLHRRAVRRAGGVGLSGGAGGGDRLGGRWLDRRGRRARPARRRAKPRLVPRLSAVVLCAFAAGLVAGG